MDITSEIKTLTLYFLLKEIIFLHLHNKVALKC